MLIPSASILLAGVLLAAIRAAFDWCVRGVNPGVNPRLRQYAWLLTGLELVDLGLSCLLAANRDAPPTVAFESAQAKGVQMTSDTDDGFKRAA
jgi:hypothetical protein